MTTRDDGRAAALKRIKLAATLLLVGTAVLFGVARHFEPMHWAWGYVAAFAAAATVGGLADWYAVVALFRRPLGLPIPHTAIIPRNHQRIAENLGAFIETNFLAPEAVEKKLGEVDFAAQVAEWLSDRERSAALAAFVLKLLPQTLTAIDQSGLRRLSRRAGAGRNCERVELAPLAAGLLSAVTETGRHQRLLNELLGALDKVLTNEETLAALREKIRKELPALFNLYRADAYLLRKIVASTTAFIEEARGDPDHALRREFDGFVQGFIERLRQSADFADRAERLKHDLLARPEVVALAEGAWDSLRAFLERDAASEQSQIRRQLETMLVDIGGQLARDAAIRAEINRGMVRVLADFVETPEERRRPLHRRPGEVLGHRRADRPHRAHGGPRPAIHPLQRCPDRRAGRIGLARAGAGVEALPVIFEEVQMADASQNFMDMFTKLGEQLKVPSFDVTKIMEHHQKNLDAMGRSWQAMATGATAVANKQREIFESAIKDITEMAKDYKPNGSPQDIFAKQAEFGKKAMEAAITNTRDIAELAQKSGADALKIIHERMQESYDEIRSGVEKK